MLQPLAQLLLALGRQTAECRIALQCAFLFSGRHIPILAQPITGVAWAWVDWRVVILTLRRWGTEVVVVVLCQTRRHQGGCNGQYSRRSPFGHKVCQPHAFALDCFDPANLQTGIPAPSLYGFAVTSCCTSRSSSKSKSE